MRHLLACALSTTTLVLSILSVSADARQRAHRSTQHKGLASTQSTAFGGPEGWISYSDPEIGAALDYPSNIFSVEEHAPKAGQGSIFRTSDARGMLALYLV